MSENGKNDAETAHAGISHKGISREMAEGRRGLHDTAGLPIEDAAAVRRSAALRFAGLEADGLENVASFSLDAARASTQNCENFIGVAQLPMGLVGPLRVRGEEDREVFLPLATTEGALLASVNRGCRAIREAGGAEVVVDDVGMTRAPVFRTENLGASHKLARWATDHFEEIRDFCAKTSRFIELVEIRPQVLGRTVLLRFRFLTGDAMGMNMATIACDQLIEQLIEPRTEAHCVALSGNYCVDKKPSAVNFQLGRGKRIAAEVVLSREILATVLKTEASALQEVQYRKNLHGSIAAGAMGFNAQFANVLAALFVACGQDVAHVVEGAMGLTSLEARDDGSVYASVYMPDVPLAAIGGGTGLDTQREALRVLGVEVDADRPGVAVRRLAEIVGGAVLAGELSLMSAFTSRDLARAHERLGRSKEA